MFLNTFKVEREIHTHTHTNSIKYSDVGGKGEAGINWIYITLVYNTGSAVAHVYVL